MAGRLPHRVWSQFCERCGKDIGESFSGMSYFNTDVCCVLCLNDEKGAPGYLEARRVEEQHVRERDYRFPGVGLSPEAEVYLRERREHRARKEQ